MTENPYVPIPIPSALRPHFEIEFTPASLLRYDRQAWDLPEIQRAIAELARLEADWDSRFRWRREWAEREMDAAWAAYRGLRPRGPKPGMKMNIAMLDVFEQAESMSKDLPHGTELIIALPVTKMRYRYALLGSVQPGRGVSVFFLGDLSDLDKDDEFEIPMARGLRLPVSNDSLHRIVSVVFGFSIQVTRQRLSRARDHVGKRRRRYRERRRRMRCLPARA